ncbi:MAG: tetratricopeptide repeat protein [Bacteroidota bacterium]
MKTIGLIFTVCIMLCGTQAQSLKKGIELYEQGKLEEARKTFSSTKGAKGESSYYLGRIAFDQEQYSKSVDYFEEAVDANDKSSDYYNWLGNARGRYAQESNMFRKGILAPRIKSAYEKAVELDETNIDAHWGLIEFYTQAPGVMGGSWEKAEETAKQIKKLDVLEGHNAMATVYQRQEKYDLAEKEYIAASKVDDARLVNLGFFYQGRGKYAQAFEAFEQAYSKDPNRLGALYQIGRTSALSGLQKDKGIASLEKYLAMEQREGTPSHAGAWMRLAMIYEKSGNKEKAQKLYSKSLSLDPEMEEAKKGLARLN